MPKLRVLLIDDSEDETLLLKDELAQGGYAPEIQRVETAEKLREALQNGVWDILLLDYFMPKFDAPAAMKIYRECGADIPCLILSSQLADENAVDLMRAGAKDFISKHRRSRLLPAISRELEETRQRRERKTFEMELVDTNRALNTLSQCNQVLIHAHDEMGLLNEICRTLEKTGNYAIAWISLTGDGIHFLKPTAWGLRDPEFVRTLIPHNRLTASGNNPERDALVNARPCIVTDLEAWNCAWKKEALQRGYRGCASIPLREDQNVFATLSVCVTHEQGFLPREISILEELAGDIAFGLQTIRTRLERDSMRNRLSHVLLQTVQAIAATVEKRDPYTAGHQQRVSHIAARIATELGLTEEQVEGVRLGGIIHDIGKIYVPAEILSRPGKLSKMEFELIQTHPQVGYDIIKEVEFPWPIQEMVLQHHERLDGSGYPAGLKGDWICLEARILAVADVVESINSHRPYRAALGLQAALDEIRKGAGRLYDPGVVEVCVALLEREGL